MFSQLRHAVESLAQSPPHPSSDDQHVPAARSRSLDVNVAHPSSPLSSSQLAESALLNLRKSLGSGTRSNTSSPVNGGSPGSSKAPKSNLEERLRRAAFAIGEASAATNPDVSAKPSPPSNQKPAELHPLSPSSTPLPDSPTINPTTQADSGSQSPPTSPSLRIDPLSLPPPCDATNNVHVSSIDPNSEETESAKESMESNPLEAEFLDTHSSPSPPLTINHDQNMESVQDKLRLVEQRFTDVSVSFKQLQAEKLAADLVLRELTPIESIQDSAGLQEFIRGLISEAEMFQDEIKRLNNKLERQEDRIEELRDTHRLESKSQSEQIEKLKTQLSETEALFQAAQESSSQAEETTKKHKADLDALRTDADKLKTVAKEEEEKRVKAISLLKTVRQKLVKAEKEREDAMKEVLSIREKERGEKERENNEKARLQREIEAVNAEKEKTEAGLKAHFEREAASLRERYDKEISSLKAQFEQEVTYTKNMHSKELTAKSAHISTLEASLNNVTRDKNSFFEQLQMRQAEVESAQSTLENIQHQNTELQFQLRESNDRLAMLREECAELQREHENRTREPVTSAGDVAQMISSMQARYESKIEEMKKTMAELEKERNDAEADWSRKLKERVKELDDLKRVIGSAAEDKQRGEEIISGMNAEISRAKEEARILREQVAHLPTIHNKISQLEKSSRAQEEELNAKISVLEGQIQEHKARESQLRQSNKAIRDELRKVQASAALLERQRNPGVGYWTSRPNANENNTPADTRTSVSSSESHSRAGSPAPVDSKKDEEDINLEYLRNVILQFLEHKEMRPNLVKVLSIILHFTPQETRRLIAKV